jgi:hypothetical protein
VDRFGETSVSLAIGTSLLDTRVLELPAQLGPGKKIETGRGCAIAKVASHILEHPTWFLRQR